MKNLTEIYGINRGAEVGTIELGANPYTFEGTFQELYGLVAEGKLKLLKQNGMVVGGSISGYDTIEQDNLAGEAFNRAYSYKPLMQYVNLAVQLVESNIIPQEIVEDYDLKVRILNNIWLDLYGNETSAPTKKAVVADEDEDVYKVPGILVDDDRNIKNYIRKTEGRCLARGCEPTIRYNEDEDEYEVTGIQWGRKLTEAERDAIEYEVE